MSRLCNVQEILWIFTPVLVFFTFFIDSATSSRINIPFAFKFLLKRVLKLCQLDGIWGENTKVEWSLIFLLVDDFFSVWNDHILNGLLFVFWSESTSTSYFSLSNSILSTFNSLKHDIFPINLPKPIFFGADTNNQEINRSVITSWNFLIFLHYTHNDIALFLDSNSELRIVKPFTVSILGWLHFFGTIFAFFRFH